MHLNQMQAIIKNVYIDWKNRRVNFLKQNYINMEHGAVRQNFVLIQHQMDVHILEKEKQ